jgi:hypothetical protein
MNATDDTVASDASGPGPRTRAAGGIHLRPFRPSKRRHSKWLRRAALLLLLVPLVPLAAISTSMPVLSRGPYLQLLTRTSVTIVWRTDVPADCAVDVWATGTTTPTRVAGVAGAVECVIAVDGLRPGRAYDYVPLADGEPLTSSSRFRTDDTNRPYTFLALGDSGSGDEEQFAVAALMAGEPADFIVHTGDMIYPDAVAEEWDPKFFVPYEPLLRRVALWPSIGNHDIGADDGESWRDVFHTPANNTDLNERYYSFRYGNARFIVLDTYDDLDPGSAQYDFLTRELGSSVATWKFVVFHDTIYSNGEHGSDDGIRADLVPVFDEFGVDVVFMGHDHHYERTWPLRGDAVVPEGQGIVYVTTGGGGASVRETGSSGFTAHAESTYHYLRVSVDGGLLNLEMVRDDGSVGDAFSLVKELPTFHDVTPIADTYIEAEDADGLEHGGAEELKVDANPRRIAYFKFDLRRLRTDVRSARLSLFPTNGSDDGGTVYFVADSTWVEGEGDGTPGQGLKWSDVDTNGDHTVDAADRSPWAPDLAAPLAAIGPVEDGVLVTVDVMAAFHHRGPGIYTLAIASDADNGTSYAAREHEDLGKQPQLLLELSSGLCGNGTVEPGEECEGSACCTACEIDPVGAPCADDGLFCTGEERCNDLGECEGMGDPCGGGGECASGCDEGRNACADPAGTPCSGDGLFCTEDACDGAGACLHTPVAACPVVADQGPPTGSATDCYGVIAGIVPSGRARADCRDGDPTCDTDGAADGRCTFELQVCVLQRDFAGCLAATEPVTVERLTVKPRTVSLSLPPLPATGPACGAPTNVVVTLKRGGQRPGKRALTLMAMTDGTPRKDRDKVVLRCLPAGE